MARKKVDSVIDVFWGALDRMAGAKERLAKSRAESAQRRAGGDASAEQPPDAASDDPAERMSAYVADANAPAPGQEPAVQTKRIAVRMPKLRLFARAKKAAAPAEPKLMACPGCGHPTPPPALYCEACHEPFLHISKALILAMVTLAVSCFFFSELYRKEMEWPWPIYVFYSACFIVINFALLKGAPKLALATFFWGAAFLGGGLFVYYYGEGLAREFLLDAVNTFGRFLGEQAPALVAFIATMAIAVGILFFWMARRYSLTHAYRIIFMGLAIGAFAAKFALRRAVHYKPIADSLSFLDFDAAEEGLDLLSINLVRVMLAELVVYSMVKAIKPATAAFASKRVRPKPKAGAAKSPIDQFADAFYGLSIMLMNAATRFYLQIGCGFAALWGELRDLARHTADFVWTLLRDLVVPVAALSIAAWSISNLAEATGLYVESHRALDLLPALGAATCIFIAQLLFLAARCRILPSRLLSSQLFLVLWFSPYALILFLFLSFSLYAAGLVVRSYDEKLEYGFRLGWATLGAFILLLIALVFAVLRRHRDGDAPPEGDAQPQPDERG